jgi:hypothetical protein
VYLRTHVGANSVLLQGLSTDSQRTFMHTPLALLQPREGLISPRPSQAQPSSATPAQPVPARPTISAAAVPPSAHAAPRCAWQLPACRCCCIPSSSHQGAVEQVVLRLRAATPTLTVTGMLGGDRKPVSFDNAASGEVSPAPAAGRALGTGLGGLDSSGGAGLDDPAAR